MISRFFLSLFAVLILGGAPWAVFAQESSADDACATEVRTRSLGVGGCVPVAECSGGSRTTLVLRSTLCAEGEVCCYAEEGGASMLPTEPATPLGGDAAGEGAAATESVPVAVINPLGVISASAVIGRVIAWFGTAAGALFMLYLLWGGVEWMTARGDEERTRAGMNRILAASSGIAIILLAYMIVATIIGVIPK